ncbi:putative cell cycle serine/threonine-protein kinase CDC5 like protein [Cucumispora dikerogammari]|nr:putative cell cycle serine/threonine-protein kinase CDC5 like protein [Cucumispora dikerogammari]
MLKTNTIIDSENNTVYKLIKTLGKGAFAVVFEAINTSTNEKVAIKSVNINNLSEKSLKKLDSEILIQSNLNHERIVKLYRTFSMKSLPTKIKQKDMIEIVNCDYVFLVLELCQPHSLSDLLKNTKHGRFSKNLVKRLGKQIFEALIYMHSHSVVHRDIKLSNILMDSERNIKIGDFGLAALVSSGEKKTTICGTPNYIAPEVLTSGRKINEEGLSTGHSFEVDIWSVGIALYVMLIGTPPFSKSTAADIYKEIRKSPLTFKNEIDEESKDLLRRLLDKNPATRLPIEESLSHKFFREMSTTTIINDLRKNIKNKQLIKVPGIKKDFLIFSIYLQAIKGMGLRMKSGVCGVYFEDNSSIYIVPKPGHVGRIESLLHLNPETEQFVLVSTKTENNKKILKKEILETLTPETNEKARVVLYFRHNFCKDLFYTQDSYTIVTRIKRIPDGYLFGLLNQVLVFDFMEGNVVVNDREIIIGKPELYEKMGLILIELK